MKVATNVGARPEPKAKSPRKCTSRDYTTSQSYQAFFEKLKRPTSVTHASVHLKQYNQDHSTSGDFPREITERISPIHSYIDAPQRHHAH